MSLAEGVDKASWSEALLKSTLISAHHTLQCSSPSSWKEKGGEAPLQELMEPLGSGSPSLRFQ